MISNPIDNCRVAIVTGGSRGIGRAIVERLARDGCCVVSADLRPPSQAGGSELDGRIRSVLSDVTSTPDAEGLVADTLSVYGRIDVLVNNAGISGASHDTVGYPDEEWSRVIDVNLGGVFKMMRAVLPSMIARGSGRIVNIASISGKEGNPRMPAYSASKAGVIGLTKAIAREIARSGVLINCVAPALIDTEILEGFDEQTLSDLVGRIPMGRMGHPEEVAALVSWLTSEDCTFSTGAVFDISGGRATY